MAVTLPDRKDVLRFYEKVILDYNCGDINWLLKKQSPALGPLLACVGAGIDTNGGMMRGFGEGSTKRSVWFMEQFMGMDNPTAEIVYRCVRCGYMHEGIRALSVGWFADYERHKRGVIIYSSQEIGLAVNAVELAHVYLDAVKHVWKDQQDDLGYLPTDCKAEEWIDALWALGLPSLENLADEVGEMRGSYSREGILHDLHYWDYEGYSGQEP